MPRIPFTSARIPDGLPDVRTVEYRLRDFLERLRREADAPMVPDAQPHSSHQRLARHDKIRIGRRAKVYVDRAKAATGVAHLNPEARGMLDILRGGAALVAIPSKHRADEIAAALHAEMPWMAPATEIAWRAMRRSVRDGDAGLRLPPMLLVGPPGIGKSHWARCLAQEIGLPTCPIEATSEPAGFSITGSQRGWSSASPGKPMQMVLRTLVANPVVIVPAIFPQERREDHAYPLCGHCLVDEVEKAGQVTDTKGRSHDLTAALLPLLERSSAAVWPCPYFQIPFDMSWMSWVLTANATSGLSEPLLSRCPPLRLPALTREQLCAFTAREAGRRYLPKDALDAILKMLSENTGSGRRD